MNWLKRLRSGRMHSRAPKPQLEYLERRNLLSLVLQGTFTTGTVPFAVVTADVLVANDSNTTVSVLLGNGTGTLAAKQDFSTGANPYAVALADFNGDGKLDVAVANSNSATVSLLLGNGNGTLAAKQDFATG